MELIQSRVGSEIPFWELPFPIYGRLAPDGWMKNTWEALAETNFTLRGPDITVKQKREHNVHLMDAFIDQEFTTKTLTTLQKC